MFLGILIETVLFIFLLYVPGVNKVFGGRPLDFWLLGIPGLGFSMMLLLWEETRKFLINWDTNNGKPNWFQRNLLWWFMNNPNKYLIMLCIEGINCIILKIYGKDCFTNKFSHRILSIRLLHEPFQIHTSNFLLIIYLQSNQKIDTYKPCLLY